MRHIAGDSLEHSRIRLERDIDNNIPSPPSMSFDFAPRDDDDISSVDFPRHNSHHPSFHSFEHASHLDSDFYSRHGDDDSIALDPDLGHTMSTAAHHASALTLSAGLRGRSVYNNTTGRVSPSGAEYDPDRPLQAILNNRVVDGISLFDTTSRSKSQTQARTAPSFDPVVVDSTAELDRFLRTGHDRPALVYPYQSRSHSQPTSDTSESDASHPRLANALGRDFSPKRPRSAPTQPEPTIAMEPSGRTSKPKAGPSHLNPTVHPPKPKRTAPPAKQQPARVDPMKDGPKDSDATPRPSRGSLFSMASRAPFSELGNKHTRVHLPDVTGLTSAVQSPAKNDAIYTSVHAPPARTSDLLPALDALQKRLQALEHANSVSRRRVRELEHELEGCRAEVLAERTRIEEREREVAHASAGRYRAATESRYRTVVAEKKALEALLVTLRSHLARLTAELATHKTVIESLRSRGGRDARTEIQTLRTEVERLAGEVERLKAVVEEGLRERRRTRQDGLDGEHVSNEPEQSQMPAQVGIDLTYVTVPVQQARSNREEPPTTDDLQAGFGPEDQEDNDDEGPEYAEESEYPQDYNHAQNHVDKSHEHDQQHQSQVAHYHQESDHEQEPASISEPELPPKSNRTQRYIHASELARVEVEMRERRSERSRSTSGQKSRDNDSGNGSSLSDVMPVQSTSHRDPHMHEKENEDPSPASSPPRPAVRPAAQPRTPFPQIRGSRMERLFFSAPEHNVRTCAVCHRRKHHAPHPHDFQKSKDGWVEATADNDEDVVRAYLRKRAQRPKAPPVRSEKDGDGDRPPPQTVLARVVRELEDDFSHYKAIYLELAEQYGVMDAASNVAKRNVLADHLRDVIDTLEQKGDQIASLYDLLTFQDKPLPRKQQTHQKSAAFA